MTDFFPINVLILHRHSINFLVSLHDLISDLKKQFQGKVRFADGYHSFMDTELPFNHFFNGVVSRMLILIHLLDGGLQSTAETLIPCLSQDLGRRRSYALVNDEFIHDSFLFIGAEAFTARRLFICRSQAPD
jgi:hypothetical protein